jgi:hypothetical protein
LKVTSAAKPTPLHANISSGIRMFLPKTLNRRVFLVIAEYPCWSPESFYIAALNLWVPRFALLHCMRMGATFMGATFTIAPLLHMGATGRIDSLLICGGG